MPVLQLSPGQVLGHCRLGITLLACSLAALIGCRGSSKPREPNLSLAPAADAVVAPGASLPITASGNVTKYTDVVWVVVEADRAGIRCTEPAHPPKPAPPPAAPCPFGWLEVEMGTESAAQARAIYHAPVTPGTYHVLATADYFATTASASTAVHVVGR
jgi:hypothetical protein